MRSALFLMIGIVACSRGQAGDASADSAFAQVQHRGRIAMGVDQYTSTHHFDPTSDGGLITLQRDTEDSAGVAQIRRHMVEIAEAFREGHFAIPGFVHDQQVPGTATMAERRARISYRPDTVPRGAVLRITSGDSTAVAAIHEFLAFQRRDHHATDADHP
jgi:hypothetical protein